MGDRLCVELRFELLAGLCYAVRRSVAWGAEV